MSRGNSRAALAALDSARPVVARLDVGRNPEDLAADIIDAWKSTETALRALVGGSTLSGQALITDLRARQFLSLDQTHAMLAFLAARDRVQQTSYRPSAMDVAAAREGFQKLEIGLVSPADPMIQSSPAAAAPVAEAYTEPRIGRRRWPLLVGIPLLLLLVAAGVWYFLANRETEYERGMAEYRRGNVIAARDYLQRATRDDPDDARPYVVLARIARDQNDIPTARQHLEQAIRLDAGLAAAHREMGQLMLSINNPELARRFLVRASQLDPADRTAQGWLGCSMMRLGRYEEGMRFISRAGQGGWSACVPPPAPAVRR